MFLSLACVPQILSGFSVLAQFEVFFLSQSRNDAKRKQFCAFLYELCGFARYVSQIEPLPASPFGRVLLCSPRFYFSCDTSSVFFLFHGPSLFLANLLGTISCFAPSAARQALKSNSDSPPWSLDPRFQPLRAHFAESVTRLQRP